MPSDLWYFYESDLDTGNLVDFYNKLPSHLQNIFEKSMGGINGTDRVGSNVVQGYRGPHTNGSCGDSEHLSPLNGLQEVKFWWGTSKHVNWVPFGGQVMFLYGRIVGDTKWHSVYFDSKTEECLSHDKEIAASKLNDKGNDLLNNGKFKDAKEYFSNAYYHSNNSTKFKTYSANKDKAQVEIDAELLNNEGNILFNQGKYSEAKQKYQAAFDKSKVKIANQKYSSNKDKTQVEIDAELLNSEGNTLFNEGKYSEAKQKYQAAFDKSQVKISNLQYCSNRDKAQVEIDAELLNSEGNILFNRGKYSEAKQKYQAAYDKSQLKISNLQYCSNRDKAQTEMDALNLNSEGNALFAQEKYSEAKQKYEAAFYKSKLHCSDHQYCTNREKAQVEIDALKLNSEGNVLFAQEKYSEAKQKYEAAHEISQVKNASVKYKVKIERTQFEIDSIKSKEQGDEEFKLGKYENALIKYQVAKNLSTVYKNKTELKECINKTKSKITDMSFDEFDSIIKESCSVGKLQEFAIKLEKMIDKGHGNDAQIVNRYHIIHLRIARLNMISQLEATDECDLIDNIIILIETELEVLKELKIKDKKLENELKYFYNQLTEHEENTNENHEVDITSIGTRVCEIGQEIESKQSERLDQVMYQQT